MTRAAPQATGPLLLFRAGGRRLALPASRVREVDRPHRLTPVPNAPASLLGLANLRGAVLPVLSMAGLLDKPHGTQSRIIVVEGSKPFGLAVDQVEAVVETAGSDRQADEIDIDGLIAARFADLAAQPAGRGERVRAVRDRHVPATAPRLASFMVAGQEFALPLDAVAEVIALPKDISPLPHADPAVVGIAAWRGGLLPILSLAKLLALPDARSGSDRVVVARIGEHRVGLVVGAMRDVIGVEADQLDPLPSVLARRQGEARIDAVARLDGGRRLVSVLAANRLLDDRQTASLLAAGGAQESEQVQQVAESRAFLMLRLGGQRFGLPIEAIDEVRRRPSRLTRLPGAPPFVRGLMNLRDHAVPVIDQGDRFGISASERRHVVIARSGALRGAFLVDAILGMVRLPVSILADMPPVGTGLEVEHVVDMEDGGQLTMILSPFELLEGTQRAMLAAVQAGAPS